MVHLERKGGKKWQRREKQRKKEKKDKIFGKLF